MSNERELIAQQLNDSLKENGNHRKIIKMSIGKFLESLSQGKIEVKTVADLEKLIKLDMLLKEEEIKNLTHLSNISPKLKRVK